MGSRGLGKDQFNNKYWRIDDWSQWTYQGILNIDPWDNIRIISFDFFDLQRICLIFTMAHSIR